VTSCRALGAYRYNAALGESQRLAFTQWVDAEVIERWLEALPDSANSGDIYARLQESGNPAVKNDWTRMFSMRTITISGTPCPIQIR
jgi:hypothetical protein